VKRIEFESDSGVWYLWCSTLREDVKAMWDMLVEALPDGALLNFEQLQLLTLELIATYASVSERAQQIEYVRTVKKPLNLECRAFLIKLRNLNAMAELLPGTAQILDEDLLKRSFVHAMPISWQNRFEQMGRNFETTDIKDLCQYFSVQEKLANASAKLSTARQKNGTAKSDNDNGNKRQRTGNGKNRRSKRGKSDRADNDTSTNESKSKKQRSDAAPSTRIADTDPCPVHPGMGHTWIKCNSNKYNTNSRSNTGKPGAKKSEGFVVDRVGDEVMMAEESPRWGSEAAVNLTQEPAPVETTTGKTSILESLCCTADCGR
jgi:hypothetical protein